MKRALATEPQVNIDIAGPHQMRSGAVVLLCTDGIVEAMDAGGKQFGVARLKELIRKNLALPIAELVKKIGDEVQAHYVAEAPDDDLTVLALRRTA